RGAEHLAERRGERREVAVRKGSAAGTDGLRQAASRRGDDRAAAGDPLESHVSERLAIARRHDQELMAIQLARDLLGAEPARERDAVREPEPRRLRRERRPLRSVADQGEPRSQAVLLEESQGVEQQVEAFVRDEPPDRDELAVARDTGQRVEEVVSIT